MSILNVLFLNSKSVGAPLHGGPPPPPLFDAGPLMTVAEVLYAARSHKGSINTSPPSDSELSPFARWKLDT